MSFIDVDFFYRSEAGKQARAREATALAQRAKDAQTMRVQHDLLRRFVQMAIDTAPPAFEGWDADEIARFEVARHSA